ncbi:MAG: DUF3368 domain-containing protein [Verrucomicrobiae bacterium]|nr:DUF3368 domain-containing protein [Verrucomicrobiae bacterium]
MCALRRERVQLSARRTGTGIGPRSSGSQETLQVILVAGTGPIIALAKADCLNLLPRLATEVLIPRKVHRELLAKTGSDADRIEAAIGTIIRVRAAGFASSKIKAATDHLGEGEREVIHLALSCSPVAMILMDDQTGRKTTTELGLPVIGTIGLLVAAKERSLISSVSGTLLLMRTNGYWLSDKSVSQNSPCHGGASVPLAVSGAIRTTASGTLAPPCNFKTLSKPYPCS